VTHKNLHDIKGASMDIDSVSLLVQICDREFQIRPAWKHEEVGGAQGKFKVTL
jgi:hypothetical protein